MDDWLSNSLKYVIDNTRLGENVKKNVLMDFGMDSYLANAIESAQRALLTPIKIPRHGLFIVVSGIDKSGKETHSFNLDHKKGISSIEEFLTARGLAVKCISQPSYNTIIGSLIFKYLRQNDSKSSVDNQIAWILWSLDRVQHNASVAEWLKKHNNIVLAKRWTESNLVYQRALGVNVDDILNFERNIIKPDLIVVLDITLETFIKRLATTDADSYEKVDLMEKARRGYIEIPYIYKNGSWVYIDSNHSEFDVNRTILQVLDIYLKQLGS